MTRMQLLAGAAVIFALSSGAYAQAATPDGCPGTAPKIAEGNGTVANQQARLAEGNGTVANQQARLAEGNGTVANQQARLAEGEGPPARLDSGDPCAGR
jgi:uncharacterized phage infection (PIP) family protein YhgE